VVRAAGGPLSMRYDAIVVDEAQDLPQGAWPGLTAALKAPETGYLMILNDDRQHPFPPVTRMPRSEVVLVLEHNMRNASRVLDAFDPLFHARVRPPARDGPATRFVHCSADDAGSVAEGVIERLLESRWARRDIAVLTTGDPHPRQAARFRWGEGAYWDAFLDDDQVFYGHALGFKGLERPVVVLVVNEDQGKDGPRERLYVGMSRACDALVVCGDTRFLESVGGSRMVRDLVQANLADRYDVGERVG
jgi:hypothetical protein